MDNERQANEEASDQWGPEMAIVRFGSGVEECCETTCGGRVEVVNLCCRELEGGGGGECPDSRKRGP